MLVVTPYLGLSSAMSKSVQVSEKNIYGFYAVDAGIEYAIWKLRMSIAYTVPEALPENVNGMETSFTIEQDGAPVGDLYKYIIDSYASRSGQQVMHARARVTRQGAIHPYQISITEWEIIP